MLDGILAFEIENDLEVLERDISDKRDPISKFYTWMIVLTIIYVLVHHATNEYFYRTIVKVWESIISESFYEEFARK